jgi:hypothetical protein
MHVMVVDVSNIAKGYPNGISYGYVRYVLNELRQWITVKRCILIADSNFVRLLNEEDRPKVEALRKCGELVVAPAGVVADHLVLSSADRHGGIVISNDVYREFHGQYPWVRHSRRRVTVTYIPFTGVEMVWSNVGHAPGEKANPDDFIGLSKWESH